MCMIFSLWMIFVIVLVKVSKNAPSVNLTIEKEGHTHAFCCINTRSAWVANHTVDVIKEHDLTS